MRVWRGSVCFFTLFPPRAVFDGYFCGNFRYVEVGGVLKLYIDPVSDPGGSTRIETENDSETVNFFGCVYYRLLIHHGYPSGRWTEELSGSGDPVTPSQPRVFSSLEMAAEKNDYFAKTRSSSR
jgi:hypothetical protein